MDLKAGYAVMRCRVLCPLLQQLLLFCVGCSLLLHPHLCWQFQGCVACNSLTCHTNDRVLKYQPIPLCFRGVHAATAITATHHVTAVTGQGHAERGRGRRATH